MDAEERCYNAGVSKFSMPDRIKLLPISKTGFPVPFFVAWPNGEPDFRITDPNKMRICVEKHRCWICGGILGVNQAFVVGPLTLINRTHSEPPSHLDCAEFSVRACPFLANPRTRRNERGIAADATSIPGIHISDNPGVSAIWVVRNYRLLPVAGGLLFDLPDPYMIAWFAEGRRASRAEVNEAIADKMPTLAALAQQDGEGAVRELERMVAAAVRYLPKS